MNKIIVADGTLEKVNVNKNIKVELLNKVGLFLVNEIKLEIIKDAKLDIDIKLKEETKLNFNITIPSNIKLDLNIKTNGTKGKIRYNYILEENSYLNVVKFQNVDSIKEMVSVKLNGDFAHIDYNFKTISYNKETYDYQIFHNAKNTISNIKNNGVCIKDGVIIYQVSSFVPKDITKCIVTQNNRIINLTNNKCEILPNLYIDTNDVEATHSALIGKFSDEEMFYMESRGIDYNTALGLLVRGFLTSDIKSKVMLNEIDKNIKKHWR